MKLFIKDFFSKYDQILSYLRIWSHSLKKSLTENSIFRAFQLYLNIFLLPSEVIKFNLKSLLKRISFKEVYFNPFSTNVSLTDKAGSWLVLTSKIFEKHLWRSDILSKDASHQPESLLKMSLFHRNFSNILLVKNNYLVST